MCEKLTIDFYRKLFELLLVVYDYDNQRSQKDGTTFRERLNDFVGEIYKKWGDEFDANTTR